MFVIDAKNIYISVDKEIGRGYSKWGSGSVTGEWTDNVQGDWETLLYIFLCFIFNFS